MDRDTPFRFETFVVGAANRLAVAAARAVAQSPGTAYNPLFIYAGSGLGKTHLLGAVGQLATQLQPQLTVCYAIVDELVEQLHTAVSLGEIDDFRQRYQSIDVLLLDDVQFLAGRSETQSEILRLFNVLQRSGKQIVLASDRPPAEISDLDERLITRFSGGLIVDIGAPDYETRAAILRRKVAERELQFEPGVLEEVARLPFTNVRELQGALNRLIASQTLGEQDVTVENVHTLLGEGVRTGEYEAVISSDPPPSESDEFASFLSELADAVAENIEPWRVRVGEAMTRWHAAGYRTGELERALASDIAPDVEALLGRFTAAVDRLRELAGEAAALDERSAASDVFLDPDRLAEAERLVARLAGVEPPPPPSIAFTRESFEVGTSNQLAAHAADELVGEPGTLYNPFFVHGPSGIGKTHLVSAIGNELVAVCGGAMSVAYVHARDFVSELITALEAGKVEEWRARYRAVDALIIDDVQLLGGKERTQEELYHLFNALHAAGRQIVLAGDRPPKALDVEERLRSRFEGGLVAQIQPPDRALRERLFARLLTNAGAEPDRALLEYLGARPADSARDIAAVVDRLVAAAALTNEPLTAKFARQELTGSRSPAAMVAASGRTVDAFFLDPEKVIWEWPDVGGRAIEELR